MLSRSPEEGGGARYTPFMTVSFASPPRVAAPNTRLAALFIDFENVYYFLKNRIVSEHDPNDLVVRLIRELRSHISDEFGAECILNHAYADFERIQDGSQGALYLLGVETHNVLGTDHKNAADMRLCIDVMEALYVRPQVEIFVVMAGDRDYIPVIQHLKKHGKGVLVVGFADNVSGDLVQIVGQDHLIDAKILLGEGVRFSLLAPEAKGAMIDQALASVSPAISGIATNGVVTTSNGLPDAPLLPDPEARTRIGEVQFAKARRITDEHEQQTLTLMLKTYGDKNEIWVGPLIHRLREEFPLLAEHERRTILMDLEEHGAIKVIKRHGAQNTYSVIVVNWDHPSIRDLYPGM